MSVTRQMAVAVAALFLATAWIQACSPPSPSSVCDDKVGVLPSAKQAQCRGPLFPPGPLLGSPAECYAAIDGGGVADAGCSDSDLRTLANWADCVNNVAACTALPDGGPTSDWLVSRRNCDAFWQAAAFGGGCRDRLQARLCPDCVDAGEPPPPFGPVDDGGAGIELWCVADEARVAFTWTRRQPSTVDSWILAEQTFAGVDAGLTRITPVSRTSLVRDAGATELRRFYLVGCNGEACPAVGRVGDRPPEEPLDAGSDGGGQPGDDGGVTNLCNADTDCASLRQYCRYRAASDRFECVTLACTSVTQCPAQSRCAMSACERVPMEMDAGGPGGDGGVPQRPLPVASQTCNVRAGMPAASNVDLVGPERVTGAPDIVGIDSARAVVIQQENSQLISRATTRRGADLADPALSTVALVAPVGENPKITYNPNNRVLFACYRANGTIYFRRSNDFGRTWSSETEVREEVVVQPPDAGPDGGADAGIEDAGVPGFDSNADCDVTVAPENDAWLTRVQGQQVNLYRIRPNGSFALSGTAFEGDATGMGVRNPRRPAIAALPADNAVIITFTADRTTVGGQPDVEVYAVRRDQLSGGTWSLASLMTVEAANPPPGAAKPGDFTTVVADPITKGYVAAWTQIRTEATTRQQEVAAVNVAFFDLASRRWNFGGDLDVQCRDPVVLRGSIPLLFPEAVAYNTVAHDSWSPTLAVNARGRIFLGLAFGARSSFQGGVQPLFRLVEFSFGNSSRCVISPSGTPGWFGRVYTVTPTPPGRVYGSPIGENAADPLSPLPTISSISADSQISFFGAYVQDIGGVEGQARFFSWPAILR